MTKRNTIRTLPIMLFSMFLFTFLFMAGGRIHAHAAGWSFGDQLQGREKEIYDLLEKNYSELQDKTLYGTTIQMDDPMTKAEADAFDWFRPQWAFLLDHSELFWISTLAMGMSSEWDDEIGDYITSSAVVYSIDQYQGVRDEISSAQKEIARAVAAVKKKKGRYAKVKAAHDYIIKLTDYPQNTKPLYYHVVTGPLLGKYSHRGVCQAYAWLFDIICKANGIPCVILEGNNHAWNYVQMEDGKWYLVDTTWDDGWKLSYDYFLVGANTSVRGKKVKQSHPAASVGQLYRENDSTPLNYPTLSKTAYGKSSGETGKTKKVSSVRIQSTVKQVEAGKKLSLKATVLPSGASNKKLKWSSSNTKYATVSSKGVVKTKKAGKGKTVKITAKAADGSGKKAAIKIKIK